MAREYRVKIEAELQEICQDVLVRRRMGKGRQGVRGCEDGERVEWWRVAMMGEWTGKSGTEGIKRESRGGKRERWWMKVHWS